MPTPSASVASFWRRAARAALRRLPTPCFVFAAAPLATQAAALDRAFRGLPVTHWWSAKTLPLPRATRWWHAAGRPVEVVSAAEFAALHAAGVPVRDILINGPAKHAWLPAHAAPRMRVNFDSPGELAALLPLARRLRWEAGLRLNTSLEGHPDFPASRTQFGFLAGELPAALRRLRAAGLEPRTLHFHLRTNVPAAHWYAHAAREALAAADAASWQPEVLDLGGGFPPAGVADLEGRPLDRDFRVAEVADLVRALGRERPHLREFWFENGRRLTAPAAALALRVLDVKEGRGLRAAICDGGRTLHAMVATWERHALIPLRAGRISGPSPNPPAAAGPPARRWSAGRALPPAVSHRMEEVGRRSGEGRARPTLVTGPTCMAFDHLGVHPLPARLRAGDVLLWMDAGAYQLSWETRFSHGLAGIAWVEGRGVEVLRGAG
ncbi:MAG: hypothetical protein ACKVYV_07425 [Limisphaerales bacterium]